jgi:cell pole-organizing protein PopZ
MSANTQSKSAEPSMEEILASIRRIISDDQAPATEPEPELPPAAKPAAPASAAKPPPQAKALEPEPSPAEPAAGFDADPFEIEEAQLSDSAESPDIEDDVLELVDPVRPSPAPQPVFSAPKPDAPPASAFRDTAPLAKDEHLLSSATDAMVASAFGTLSQPVLDTSGPGGTLDEMFRNILRPMLKLWLDENLPAIVERLVRAEIERATRYGR